MLAFAIINCAVVLGVMFEAVAYGVYQHFGRGKREVGAILSILGHP